MAVSTKTQRNVSTGLEATSQLFKGAGAYKAYGAKEKGAARSAALIRKQMQEILRRAEVRRGEMKDIKRVSAAGAVAKSAGQGFATTSAGRTAIEGDYSGQLAKDLEVLNQETMYEMMLQQAELEEAQRAEEEARKAKKGSIYGTVLGVGGSILGGIYGGPGGAVAGGAAGSAAGQYIGSR